MIKTRLIRTDPQLGSPQHVYLSQWSVHCVSLGPSIGSVILHIIPDLPGQRMHLSHWFNSAVYVVPSPHDKNTGILKFTLLATGQINRQAQLQ